MQLVACYKQQPNTKLYIAQPADCNYLQHATSVVTGSAAIADQRRKRERGARKKRRIYIKL